MDKVTIEDIRSLLNSQRPDFYVLLRKLSLYITTMPEKAEISNYIVATCRDKKIPLTDMNMFQLFYKKIKPLITGTVMTQDIYATQQLLRKVWEATMFFQYVVKQIRNNYHIQKIGEDPKVVVVPVKKEKHKETPEERKARLIKHAEEMRKAKARIKQESEGIVVPEPKEPVKPAEFVPSNKPKDFNLSKAETVKGKKAQPVELTDEMKKQIAMLIKR